MNFREVLRSIRVGSNVLRRIVPCCPRSVSAGLAGIHPVGRVQQLSPRHSREREEILRRFRAFLSLFPHLQASSLFIFFGIGAAFGNVLSGLVCRFFYRVNRSYLPLAVAIGYLISMPLLSVLFSPSLSEGLSVSVSFLLHALLLAVLGVLLNIPGPALKSILLNVNRPQCRGTATAIGEVFNNAGRIVGPIVFTQMLREGDRVAAMLKISAFFYVSAALSFLLRFTIERDEDAVQEYVQNMKLSPLSPMSNHEEKTENDPLLQHV